MKKDQKTSNPFIFTKKTSFMQRVSDLVRLNYTRYVTGEISIEKLPNFYAKLNEFYELDINKALAYCRRKEGFCTARLLILHQKNNINLQWVLLITDGNFKHKDGGREKWLDPIKNRIYLTGYELVRHQRASNPKPSWSWKYEAKRYDEIRSAIILSIRRKHDEEIKQWINTIFRSPGFALVREQVKKLAQLIKSEWKRNRGVECDLDMPKNIGSVRRIPDKGCLLSELIKELKNADSEKK